jgi:GntR family transcriptional regulator, transcriptional repressor for pyruvate dehydrogenase complex
VAFIICGHGIRTLLILFSSGEKKVDRMLKVIKRLSLVETIIEQLVNYIQIDLKPGDKMASERELIEELGVGRSSLREAIRALEVMGLVEARLGEGTFVTTDKSIRFQKPLEWGVFGAKKTVKDVFEARSIIEVAIMPLVVEKIDDLQISEMKLLLKSMENVNEDHDLLKYLNLDFVFHKNLADYADNDILREVINLTHRILEEERTRDLLTKKVYVESLENHRKIVDALVAHDVDFSVQAMKEHMHYTKKLLKL